MGLLSFPAWLAAFGYSVATFAAWWMVYFVGGRFPLGPTNNDLASLSQIFGYSAYALFPVTAATAAISLAGVVVVRAGERRKDLSRS